MYALTSTHPTLARTLAGSRHSGWVGAVGLVVTGALALTLAAKVSIPFWPVPLTLQTFVLLVMAMAYGRPLAVATVAAYLGAGAVGLPVFAGVGAGPSYLMGTTGGYLLGFLIAAGICGHLAQRGWDRNIVTTAAAMLIGNVIIYVPGLLWLGTVVGWDQPVLAWGLTPFLLGDALKLALAATLLPAAWHLVGRGKGPET